MIPSLKLYEENYEERQLLGRGNYGSAYLVKSRVDSQFYVAKKIMLDGLSQKQKESAFGQIEILQKFSYQFEIPFIVQYKQSFYFENNLIIVMQYCEFGDISSFLKNWKKREDKYLDERVIVNWFVQIIFGVRALHNKNVLHRDLKSANLFITANKTVKIGDFGISKVLESSSAKTFVGTPYYLSPEVCQNRPYNYKSDLWSLGCILFELCTFTYPFQGSNLLSLAMKILNENTPAIPSHYHPDLTKIVRGLLTKDETKRLTIDQILSMDYIKKHITSYTQQAERQKINVLVKFSKKHQQKQGQVKHEKKLQNDQTYDTMKTIKSNFQQTTKQNTSTLSFSNTFQGRQLTTKEKLAMKKLQQAKQRQQELNQHMRTQNLSIHDFAKTKKMEQLGLAAGGLQATTKMMEKQIQDQNKKVAELKKTQNNCNLKKLQTLNMQQLSQSIKNYSIKPLASINTTRIQDRPLPTSVPKYGIQKIEEQIFYENEDGIQEYNDQPYYPDDFETYDQTQQIKPQQNIQQQKDVEAFYNMEAGNTVSPSKKAKIDNIYKEQTIIIPKSTSQKAELHKQKCISLIGKERYQQLYKLIKNKQLKQFEIKQLAPKIRQAINQIDMVLFFQQNS